MLWDFYTHFNRERVGTNLNFQIQLFVGDLLYLFCHILISLKRKHFYNNFLGVIQAKLYSKKCFYN